MSPLGLYLHIPFCASICGYCNFNRGLLDESLKIRYVAALEREILEAGAAASERSADTIFFGGGTPSLLDPKEVSRLIHACRAAFDLAPDAEITLETNPETVDLARLSGFRASGVTRISFGVQSFDAAELARLDRLHSAERAVQAIADARSAGFENVSLDLMFWLPGQSMASWLATVDRAIELDTDHLSLYLLELYPNAPLKEAMARKSHHDRAGWEQATDDEAADMYLAALERLADAGLAQYEISNVATAGRECRHNVKYWQGGRWQGFGCGAHSTVGEIRWKNVTSTEDYVARVMSDSQVAVGIETLGPDSRVQEALFTGLRMNAGIDCRNFLSTYGVNPWTLHGDTLAPYVADGLMWREGQRFGLTRRGMLLANEILVAFV